MSFRTNFEQFVQPRSSTLDVSMKVAKFVAFLQCHRLSPEVIHHAKRARVD
jgi:hypothetical protein